MLWPPVVLLIALLARQARRVGVALVAAVGAIRRRVWMTVLAIHGNVPYDNDASRLYFGTDTHASGLLLGCAAAAVVRVARAAYDGRRARRAAGPATSSAWPRSAAFDLGAVHDERVRSRPLPRRVPRRRPRSAAWSSSRRRGAEACSAARSTTAPMTWIGRRSYGIYLWHWPVFVVTRPVLDIALGAGALLVPRLAITVGIAALSYRFLEQPIRREGFRPWLRRVTGGREPRHAAAGDRARRTGARRRGRLRLRPRAGRGLGGAAVAELRERQAVAAPSRPARP